MTKYVHPHKAVLEWKASSHLERQLGGIACCLKHAAVVTNSVCDFDTHTVAEQLQLCLLVCQLHNLQVLLLPVLQPCSKLVSMQHCGSDN